MRRIRAALVASVLLLAGCGGGGATGSQLVAIGEGLLGPAGLTAGVYATGLEHAAAFAFDEDGRLWVATAAFEDAGDDGVYVVAGEGSDPVQVLADVHTPLGLLWLDGELYVASRERVDAFGGFDGAAFVTSRQVLSLPEGVGEVNGLAVSPGGRLALGISAPCDSCDPGDDLSGVVVTFAPDGTDLTVLASSIRAPVGLAYFPGTDDLFVTMNQRDDLGDSTPGDWLAVVRDGQDWGFPDCYGQGGAACDGVPEPVAELDEHAAVSGLALLAGQTVTAEMVDAVGTAAVVAEWATGAVVLVELQVVDGGDATRSYTGTVHPFLEGLRNPVAVAATPGGALVVGDWTTGVVYVVRTG
jgi:glucose/arabinose dehydrogenase